MEELTLTTPSIFVLGDFVDYVGLYESFFGLCIGDQELENRTRTKSDPYGTTADRQFAEKVVYGSLDANFRSIQLAVVRGLYAVYLCGMAIGCCIYLRSGFTLVGDFSRYLYP